MASERLGGAGCACHVTGHVGTKRTASSQHALWSAGVQLALLVVLVVLITIAGTLFEERGVILTMIILVYALTSVVGGYASGSHYSRSDGKVQTMLQHSGTLARAQGCGTLTAALRATSCHSATERSINAVSVPPTRAQNKCRLTAAS